MIKMTGYETLLDRAQREGISSMSSAELISIIIGGNGKNGDGSMRVSESITAENGLYNKAARLQNFGELSVIAGVSLTRRQEAKLLSAMELARRVNSDSVENVHIGCPGDAANYIMPKLRYATHEYFYCILLNAKNRVMALRRISEGSLTCSIVHPREVFSPAVALHAATILAVHNHPSGDPFPSVEDKKLTLALDKAGDALGIPLMDHIVIGDGSYYSFKEHGDL